MPAVSPLPSLAVPTSAVVICAYDTRRWDKLAQAVASVQAQDPPPDELVIIVDHNDELLARAKGAFDAIVAPNEFARGASGGRNTGARLAGSEILVFLDDDATAYGTSWLKTLLGWYADPTILAVGGPADPLWEGGSAPDWFPNAFLWTVGCSYEGQPTVAKRVRNVWACNMSVRRSAFVSVGGFKTEIGGVRRNVTLGCEETELCIRLGKLGAIMYDPVARVSHSVPANRQTWQYFARRCWTEGVSKAQVVEIVRESAVNTLGVEKNYMSAVLPRALRHSVRSAIASRKVAAVGKALAIPAGASITAAGYATERARAFARQVARQH